MTTSRLRMGRGIFGLIVLVLVATACSAGAATSPIPSAVAAATTAAAASPSAVPVATATASPAPTASPGGGQSGRPSAPSSRPASTARPTTGVVVHVAMTSLGTVLVGPKGLTLYVHRADTATSSMCTGGCAAAWPPLTVAAGTTASAGKGVTGRLGTIKRPDGKTQVTYDGKPLYGWQSDARPGDVTGQGIAGFTVAKP